MTRDPWIGRMKDDDVTGTEREMELLCVECGETRSASGGDAHCGPDCDDFDCHPFVAPAPIPTNSDHVKDFTSAPRGQLGLYCPACYTVLPCSDTSCYCCQAPVL